MQTKRLKFETIKQEHFFLLYALYRDAQTREFLGGALSKADAEAKAYEHIDNPPKYLWALKDHNEHFIGTIGFLELNTGDVELYYTILPNYWRLGYAKEAAIALLEFAENNLHKKSIIAETQVANIASQKLLKALGFKESCRLTRHEAEQIIFTR